MHYGRSSTRKRIRTVNSKSKKYANRFIRICLKGVLLVSVIGIFIGGSVGLGMVKGIIDDSPKIDINSIVPDQYSTTIYNGEGTITDTLVTAGSNREEVTYEELPKDLINAFVAIEDSRFWEHNGIDLRSIARAASGVVSGKSSGGGSTLTQQLIKNNVFGGGMEKSFGAKLERKIQEQFMAVQLESIMSKELILTNYLNTINLGNNTLGVKVAAKRYLNKEVSDLTLSESAVIAGITQNPAQLNPISGSKRNEEKRRVILQYMLEQGYISKSQREEALADDVYSRIQDVNVINKENATPYSYYTDELVEQVKEALIEKLSCTETQAHNMLYSSGLSIYTPQDPVIQAIVDEEISNPDNYTAARYSIEYRLSVTHSDGSTKHYSEENIKTYHKQVLDDAAYDGLYDQEEEIQAEIDGYKAYLLKADDTIVGESLNKILQPQASFVIMDQKTGQVKAISGGRGEKTASRTLNRATNTKRQPGSTFKIITSFAPALDANGNTLGTVYYDSEYTIGSKTFANWYKQGYLGYSSIRDGIIYSMNIVAVRCLMDTVTPQLGVEYAENFGITTLTSTDLNPATALGGLTVGVTNLELTGAFATIANGGVYNKPIFFTKILDHEGKILIDNEPESRSVLKDSTAYLLTDAMEGVISGSRKFARPNTSVNPTGIKTDIPNMSDAGKSGTTTGDNDIWFMGYTPYYTAGIWAGCDSNQKLTAKNGGASFHKKIYQNIMSRVHEGLSDPGFPVPDSVETTQICRKSGKVPLAGVCTSDPRGDAVYTEYFAKGTVPAEVCDKHVQATVCEQSGRLLNPSCPTKATRIFISVPPDSGTTDDWYYALPGYCTIHTGSSQKTDPDIPDIPDRVGFDNPTIVVAPKP